MDLQGQKPGAIAPLKQITRTLPNAEYFQAVFFSCQEKKCAHLDLYFTLPSPCLIAERMHGRENR